MVDIGDVAVSIMGGRTLLDWRGNAVVVFDSDGLREDRRGLKIELLMRRSESAMAGCCMKVLRLLGD
jgi:hypothetical protein